MLESKRPPDPLFRIARTPDAWRPQDWSRAQPDGTFGNRFDDPEGYYRVLYAASQKLSCFLETLARFRKDLSILAELNEIAGENDCFPPGKVPADWCDTRLLGTARVNGEYAEVYASEWIAFLRRKLAAECLRLGLRDLDAAVLQQGTPRRITQLVSSQVYNLNYSGIYYRSRYGHNQENWALFEPFRINHAISQSIANNDPDLLEALRILELEMTN